MTRWVAANGCDGFEEVILRACLNDQRAETWTTDRHGWYLCELLMATGKADQFLETLLGKAKTMKNVRGSNQLMGVFCELGKRGYSAAGNYLRDEWASYLTKKHKGEVRTDCAEYYIDLDGFEAYEKVLRWMQGRSRRSWPNSKQFFSFHPCKEDARWWKKAEKLRLSILESDPAFARYATFPEVEEDRKVEKSEKETPLIEKIRTGRYVSIDLADESQKKVALEALKEDLGVRPLRRLVMAITRHKLEVPVEQVEHLLTHADENIRRSGLMALKNVQSDQVRSIAFQFFPGAWERDAAIELLRLNYRPGDEATLLSLLKLKDEDVNSHADAISVLHVIEANPRGKWNDTLAYLYENGVCSMCRFRVLRNMSHRRLLTVEQLKECVFDADESCRKFAANRLRKLNQRLG